MSIDRLLPTSDGASELGQQVPVTPVTMIARNSDSGELVTSAFYAAQVDGREPFVRSFGTEHAPVPAALLPPGATVERSVTTPSTLTALARCSSGSILIETLGNLVVFTVSAPTDALAKSVLNSIRQRIVEPSTTGQVSVRMWYGTSSSGDSLIRPITVPTWPEIEHNYPESVRRNLAELVALPRPKGGGKLILWHGEPGTGKTTAIRALLQAWEPWCAAHYISDPERLFGEPSYLLGVATHGRRWSGLSAGARNDGDGPTRLIIAEDSDQYIRASARRDAGAALGRLLNLSDGMLGQGLKTLVLLTTNEPLDRLHPALIRPGRCLASIEFTRFSTAEARSWLPDQIPAPQHPVALAELYERRGDLDRIGGLGEDRPVSTGQYL